MTRRAAAVLARLASVNTPPSILLNGSTANINTTFYEGGGAQSRLTFATVADADNNAITSASMVCAGGWGDDTTSEVVSFGAFDAVPGSNTTATVVAAGGINFSLTYTDATGTVTIAKDGGGTYTTAQLQALLRLYEYNNTASPPTDNDRTFTFVCSDGEDSSASVVLTVALLALPVIDAISDTTATVGEIKTIIPNNSGGLVDSWSATGLSDGAVIDTVTGIVTWTPTIETTLNITITATNAAGSDNEAVAVTSSDPVVNTAPVILLNGSTGNESGTFTEGDAATTFLTSATVSNVDEDPIASATMVAAGGWGADTTDESVAFGAFSAVPGSNTGATVVTAGGVDFSLTYTDATGTVAIAKDGGGTYSTAALQALVRLFSYDNNATPPTGAIRTFTFVANDGTDDSTPAVLAVSLAAAAGTGDIVEVRRTTDDTTGGFTLAEFGDGTLDTFVGVGDGALPTWYDSSGNANHMTMATTANQPKVALAGTVQSGVVFQSSDYMSLGARLTSGVVTQLTIALWMKMADAASSRTIAAEMTTAVSWRLQVNSFGQLSLYRSNGSYASIVSTSTTNLDDDTWRHVVVVIDGDNVKFYLDGTLDTEITADILSSAQTGSTLFELGADRQYANYNGTMSNFQLWQSALSSTQVASVYAGTAVGTPLVRLIGNYPVEETPPPAEPTYHDNGDLANWANFEAWMTTYGAIHGDYLLANYSNTDIWNATLNTGYYDYLHTAYTIAEYIDADYALWRSRGDAWASVYEYYCYTFPGSPAGWLKFTRGLRKRFDLTGDTATRDLANHIALNGAYSADATPLAWTAEASFSREVAYGIMIYIDTEKMGAAHRAKMEDFMDQIFAPTTGHFAQWFDSPPYVPPDGESYFAPFMWGLSCLAGIQYLNEIGPDSRVLPAISDSADWVRANCWSDVYNQHLYRTNDPQWSYGPDLEMIIAPVYWWLWLQTGNSQYKTWGDASFNAAFASSGGAFVSSGKQFSQIYRWSFDGLLWRAQGNNLWA